MRKKLFPRRTQNETKEAIVEKDNF